MRFVVLVGPAGSGKSSLTAALSQVMEENGAVVARVNFDPAVEELPYDPEVDVRKYVDYVSLLKQGLGPNGALVTAVDMLIGHVTDIREEISSFEADYVIVDTPGQMELFAFRQGGPLVLEALVQDEPTLIVFLVDAIFMENPASIVSGFSLASSVALRFRKPQVNVVSKADLLLDEVREEIIPRLGEPGFLTSLVEADTSVPGDLRLLYDSLARALEESGVIGEVLPVSVEEVETLTALYAKIQQILAGGDDFKIYDLKGE